MSADAWRVCPKCKAKVTAVESKAAKAYGKVSEQEYKQILSEETLRVIDDVPETFREDYEVYMTEEGIFNVSYCGSCQVCGFEHKFKHETKLEV